MSKQQLTCLCLLDLSAAFDTIDHQILLNRLSSWFGINGTALSWLHSYLLNRNFTVNIKNQSSNPYELLHGVPQGSVLGPLLFSLYTTPLSSLISSLSQQHHLFADDTQLFASFVPSNLSDTVLSIQTSFQAISSWMSSNFLVLNPTKTELIICGNQKQLQKIDHSTFPLTQIYLSSHQCRVKT